MLLETEPSIAALKDVPVEAVKPNGEEDPVAEVVEAPPVQTAAAEPMPDAKSALHGQPIGACGIDRAALARAGFALTVIPKRIV